MIILNKDVIFVTPATSLYLKYETYGSLILASLLKYADVSVKIKRFFQFGDVNKFDTFIDNAEKEILAHSPKIVSFYTSCDIYHVCLKIAERIKKVSPETYVVFGGPQSDACAKETILAFDYVDYVCCGEGENTIVPFFKSLLSGNPDLSIDGLVYRKDGEVVINPRPALITNFDEIPFADFSLWTDVERDKKYITSLPIDVGRGCPFNCIFCSTKSFWERKYRLKSAKRIVDEIKLIHKTFNITRFKFMHDMFTMDKKAVNDLCAEIKKLDFKINWSCSARGDCLSKELIDVMVDAGLDRIFIGVESGSPRMQKVINKNLKLDKVYDIIDYIAKKEILISASYIYGFPGETLEDVSQTLHSYFTLSKYNGMYRWCHRCAFFPGTEIERIHRDELTEAVIYPDLAGDFGASACTDLINGHPEIFPQYREYNSPLRVSLRYFDFFLWVTRKIPSIYLYLSKYYTPTTLVNMYFDWEKANMDLLEKIDAHVSEEKTIDYLIENDRFIATFEKDENYNILRDVIRFYVDYVLNEKTGFLGIYEFIIDDYFDNKQIVDYQKGISRVTVNPDKTIKCHKITL